MADPLQRLKYGKAYYTGIQNAEEKKKAEAIWADANSRYQKLVQQNRQLPKKVKFHTEKNIFPAIAVYQALLAEDPVHAMRMMEESQSCVSRETGATYRKLVKHMFMKKLFLKVFCRGARKGFAEEAGFINRFVRTEKRDIAFTMEKCPYCDYCIKYGCPELTHIFCHSDIDAYGDLPGIVFERHQTLGTGGSCCDFHLYLKEK